MPPPSQTSKTSCRADLTLSQGNMKRFAESHSGSAVSSTGAVHASRRPQRTSTRHVGSRDAAPDDRRVMELAAAPRLAPRPRDALRPRPRTTRTKTQSPLLLASCCMAEERAATRLRGFPFNAASRFRSTT